MNTFTKEVICLGNIGGRNLYKSRVLSCMGNNWILIGISWDMNKE